MNKGRLEPAFILVPVVISVVVVTIMAFPTVMPIMRFMVVLVVMCVMANRSRHPDDMAGVVTAVGPVMSPADFVDDPESVVMAIAAERD